MIIVKQSHFTHWKIEKNKPTEMSAYFYQVLFNKNGAVQIIPIIYRTTAI